MSINVETTDRPVTPGFLFLQGPHGFFFPRLGAVLAARGARVRRINLTGGDQATWPGQCCYRGTAAGWPGYVRAFLARERITDLVVHGDCRPYHEVAIAAARAAGARVHVFEEGYLRPDWITLERDGVNGRSTMPADPAWFRARAAALPPPPPAPTIPPHAAARRWGAFFYYAQTTLRRWGFPFGPDHRVRHPIWEGLSYLAKFRRAHAERADSARAFERLADRPFMLFPLQLDSDYQMRAHSPFGGTRAAARFVLESFRAHAPADLVLVVKEHPLDSGLIRWRPVFEAFADEFELDGRLLFVEHGDLQALVEASRGMVTVNSTSGTTALAAGKPVAVLGRAVYDIDKLTDRRSLDAFWSAPTPPDPALFDAFSRVLADRCLIRGAFLGDLSDRMLAAAADRLLAGCEAEP
ncbi:capsule biosynthesis protein [uncultured Sphingomonas sp.]|uniref:capsule biosynthesis protein n=1 Tax=uncultured Sphingomonas sp. TaxID=158754 RepID=UPI0035CC2A7A